MRAILNFALSVACLAVAFGAKGFAQTPPAATPPAASAGTVEQAQQAPATQFIQNLGDQAIAAVADKNLSPQQRDDKYGNLLRAAFDIPTIGRFVLGRAWDTATPAQQQEFTKLFEALVVKMYGARLNLYSGEGFKVKGVRPESNQEMVVASAITHPQGDAPTEVDWRVHDTNGKLAVVDVSVAGVSQSLTQRQEYAAILERNNGNFDALLDLMRQRLNQPATATTQG